MNYKNHKTYSKHTWLPLKVIQQAIAENWLESLSYFVRLKSIYHRPIFYNYSLRKLSAHLKCSPATISHHLTILSQKGLCERVGADLHLKSNNSLRKQDKFIVPVGVDMNKANQRTLLRQCLIKRNLHKQFKTFSKKSNALKFHKQEVKNLKEYKTGKKLAEFYPDANTLENSIQPVLTLSNIKIGSICNRSKSTGVKIQKDLNRLKLIKSVKRCELVDIPPMNKRAFYESGFSGSYFLSKNGMVYKRLTNEIKVTGVRKVK